MKLRLFLGIFGLESRKLMSYRVDFWVNVAINFIAAIVVPYFLWAAVYRWSETPSLRGFTFEGMVVYICAVALLGRVVRGGDQMSDVAEDIYQGTLNRYLLYPTNYLAFKYAQHLGNLVPQLLQFFIFAPVVAFVVGIPEDVNITPLSILLTFVTVAAANLLYYLLAFPLQAVAFWADNVWSLAVMLRMGSRLLGGALIPLALFPDAARGVLTYLPFAALYHLPANTLLGKISPLEWLHGMTLALGWCLLAAAVSWLVWRRGQLTYTGVGI